MRGLAICQMQSMDILLQKISHKSKLIRKTEKKLNLRLVKKGIALEKKRCYLEPFLKNALDGAMLAQRVCKPLPSSKSSQAILTLGEEQQ